MASPAPKKMGTFERGQRYTGLTKQASLFHTQWLKSVETCEESAGRLFNAVHTIAVEQGTSWDQVLGLSDALENVLYDGVFEYHGPASVGEDLSFSQGFFLAALVGLGKRYPQGSALFAYVNCALGWTDPTYPIYQRMHLGAVFRVSRDPELWNPLSNLPWASLGRVFRPRDGNEWGRTSWCVPSLERHLDDGELPYEDATETIHNVARIRYDACAHAILIKSIADAITKLADKAEQAASDEQKTLAFDLAAEFTTTMELILTAYDKVPAETLERVTDYDRIYQKKWLGADPDLTHHVFDFLKCTPGKVFRLDIMSGIAVHQLHAESTAYDGVTFGRYGGEAHKIFLDDEEYITSARWKTGTYMSTVYKIDNVVFDLSITTTKRTLGPFGTGGEKVISDGVVSEFRVGEGMMVCGLLDPNERWLEHRGETVIGTERFLSDLRFVVTPVVE